MALHCLLACCIYSNSYAQVFENLMQLNGHQTQVFYSNGAVAKAERLATQLDGVLSFYNKQMLNYLNPLMQEFITSIAFNRHSIVLLLD